MQLWCERTQVRILPQAVASVTAAAAIYIIGHGLHTFTAVSRSTQPSTLHGLVKWVSAFSWSNNKMVMVDVDVSSLPADSQPKLLAWPEGWHGDEIWSPSPWPPSDPHPVPINCHHPQLHTAHTHHASVYQAVKLVAALLRVARVTSGLAKSNGSLPPGLWQTSPAGWLPRTGICSRTLRLVIEYGLPLPFFI